MKVAVITGASRGIGLATAKKFLAEGWRVVGAYRNTPIPIRSENFVAVRFDQGSPASIRAVAEEIQDIAPQIGALVNSAGIILDAHDTVIDMEKVRKTIEVDLFGVMDLTERLLPRVSAGGHIVNIGSLYGAFSFPIDDETSSAYRIAKAALNMYTRTLAFRLKNRGIVVSSFDPGWVKTDMGKAGATETEGPDREPEEAADEIYWLVERVAESGCFWRSGRKREW